MEAIAAEDLEGAVTPPPPTAGPGHGPGGGPRDKAPANVGNLSF